MTEILRGYCHINMRQKGSDIFTYKGLQTRPELSEGHRAEFSLGLLAGQGLLASWAWTPASKTARESLSVVKNDLALDNLLSQL